MKRYPFILLISEEVLQTTKLAKLAHFSCLLGDLLGTQDPTLIQLPLHSILVSSIPAAIIIKQVVINLLPTFSLPPSHFSVIQQAATVDLLRLVEFQLKTKAQP